MAHHWENLQTSYRAAAVRVALSAFCVTGVPAFVPSLLGYWPVLVGYLASALVFQALIKRGIGGVYRVLAGGIVDVTMLTFLVHGLGATSTPLVGAYLLTGMLNALVAPPWVARTLAALGVLSYAAVLYAESLNVISHGPLLADGRGEPLDAWSATRASVFLATLVAVSTFVSERITRALSDRETRLREANARLEELSQRDPLTQLYNRRQFVRRVDQELERVRRGHSMALLMIDLDRFKHINDEQGHLVGDELLRRIAHSIEDCTRAVDVTGRFGGDEFVVILTDTDGVEASIVAQRLVDTIRRIGAEFDPERPVTASVGVAVARAQDDVAVLLNTADDAAYRAKQAGGNQSYTQDPEHNSTKFESGPRAARTG